MHARHIPLVKSPQTTHKIIVPNTCEILQDLTSWTCKIPLKITRESYPDLAKYFHKGCCGSERIERLSLGTNKYNEFRMLLCTKSTPAKSTHLITKKLLQRNSGQN